MVAEVPKNNIERKEQIQIKIRTIFEQSTFTILNPYDDENSYQYQIAEAVRNQDVRTIRVIIENQTNEIIILLEKQIEKISSSGELLRVLISTFEIENEMENYASQLLFGIQRFKESLDKDQKYLLLVLDRGGRLIGTTTKTVLEKEFDIESSFIKFSKKQTEVVNSIVFERFLEQYGGSLNKRRLIIIDNNLDSNKTIVLLLEKLRKAGYQEEVDILCEYIIRLSTMAESLDGKGVILHSLGIRKHIPEYVDDNPAAIGVDYVQTGESHPKLLMACDLEDTTLNSLFNRKMTELLEVSNRNINI